VRVFGVAVEGKSPGIVLDTLGIPGARAETQLYWNETTHRDALARRAPALVMLAYGTNEAGDDDDPIERYEAKLRKTLTRIRATVPNASCVLIGPSDRPIEVEDDTYATRPRTAQVVETQRRVAPDYGCGFFDVVALMGGDMSMTRWVAAEKPLGAPDHVHFTRRGYEAMGNVLHDALLAGYPEAPSEPPSAPELRATEEGGPLASK
jgi:lysophospholipase L1-like esterase